jgi:hypothetical protein
MQTSLLRALSTRRTPTDPVPTRYDYSTQTTWVFENDQWVPSWESSRVGNSKKADMETGEDQKGQ